MQSMISIPSLTLNRRNVLTSFLYNYEPCYDCTYGLKLERRMYVGMKRSRDEKSCFKFLCISDLDYVIAGCEEDTKFVLNMLNSVSKTSCMLYIELNQTERFIFTNKLI